MESDLGCKLLESVDQLEREVMEVYKTLVLPGWGGELHGLPHTLYGYMMGIFARIDLASVYYAGGSPGNQTDRMVAFMDRFLGGDHEANSVAVQMWRHKLMHTAEPRYLRHPDSGVLYRWHLQWWEHLPEEQHFTFAETVDSKVLNLGLVYLIRDLRAALESYLGELRASADAQQRFRAVDEQLNSSELRL